MNLKQLECFLHVAELGSFSRAASVLSLPQPLLSRNVRQLEVDMRQTLLVRTGRGVTPTEAGKLFAAHARGILHQVQRAKEELEEIRGAPVGHIAIGLPPTMARALAAPLVMEFSSRFPKAQLRIVDGLSIHLLEWLATGHLDVALAYNLSWSPHFEAMQILEQPLCFISPSASKARRQRRAPPLNLVELSEYPLIIPGRPNAMRIFVEAELAKVGRKMTVAWEVDGVPPILDLVEEGYGYAVLPPVAIRADRGSERFLVRSIVEPNLAIPLSLATSPQRPVTPLVRQVTEVLSELVRKRLA